MHRRSGDNRCTKAPRRVEGFTLLEIMLAVTITSTVLVILYGVISDLSAAMKRADAYPLPSRTAQEIMTTLTTDLESSCIPDPKRLAFYATKDDGVVRFLSTADSAVMPDGRQGDAIEVAYVRQVASEGISLYRRESVYIDDKPLLGGRYALIATGLKAFSMNFYDGHDWLEEWNNLGSEEAPTGGSGKERGLPRAIRITLTLRDGTTYTTELEPLIAAFLIN